MQESIIQQHSVLQSTKEVIVLRSFKFQQLCPAVMQAASSCHFPSGSQVLALLSAEEMQDAVQSSNTGV
jgi:hypothetical protein